MRPPALGTLACCLALAQASAAPVELIIRPETITVQGAPAQVYSIVQPDGTRGITVDQKDGFHVVVKNELPFPTTIHWHGLIVPCAQDGVPFVTQDPIPPGGSQEYEFPLVQAGTYWMHSHYGLQEQALVSAPLIILNEEERAKAPRQVVVMLSDFAWKAPQDILASLTTTTAEPAEKAGMKMSGGGMPAMASRPARVQVWDEKARRFTEETRDQPPADIDVHYDALLANRRWADDPEVITVEPGEEVLLRMIAASSASNFLLDTGSLEAELLAVDGQGVEPLRGNFFQLGIAQRVDLRVKIPREGGTFPILALGEGTRLQTGVVLATPGTKVSSLPVLATTFAGALDNTQESRLRALAPLAPAGVDRTLPSLLGGNMRTYTWTINGNAYPNRDSLDVRRGERVEIALDNPTGMPHPMHLHGHDFQVVEIDGQPLAGAVRDTLVIPPRSKMKVQFNADNPGLWAYHCHLLYHMVRGMFTVVNYDGADTSFWQPEKTPEELTDQLP